MELERLRSDHAAAVLAFEVANRAYFAASINDRGDEFYEQFSERHRALLAEQDAGVCVFHVLVDGDGTVSGASTCTTSWTEPPRSATELPSRWPVAG